MCCAGQAPCRRLRVTSNVRHQVERPCYFDEMSAALRAEHLNSHDPTERPARSSRSRSVRQFPSTRPQHFRQVSFSQFVGRCASKRTASGYHPVAQRRGKAAAGKSGSQRLPRSLSISLSGAARRCALPVAATPRRSAGREANVARQIARLRSRSTTLLPNQRPNQA